VRSHASRRILVDRGPTGALAPPPLLCSPIVRLNTIVRYGALPCSGLLVGDVLGSPPFSVFPLLPPPCQPGITKTKFSHRHSLVSATFTSPLPLVGLQFITHAAFWSLVSARKRKYFVSLAVAKYSIVFFTFRTKLHQEAATPKRCATLHRSTPASNFPRRSNSRFFCSGIDYFLRTAKTASDASCVYLGLATVARLIAVSATRHPFQSSAVSLGITSRYRRNTATAISVQHS
jgi:hypothetical protein